MATVSLARVVLALASLACVVACKKKLPEAQRQPVGVEGANCYSSPCNPGLACTPMTQRCAKPDDPEILAAQAADRERERAFLAKSGVEHPPHLEQPLPPPPTAEAAPAGSGTPAATSGAVRVVRISNEGKTSWVFAACRPDERLVGGGCTHGEGDWRTPPGYPSGENATDTAGARWNCGWKNPGASNSTIEAFALCQRL